MPQPVRHFRQVLIWPLQLMPIREGSQIQEPSDILRDTVALAGGGPGGRDWCGHRAPVLYAGKVERARGFPRCDLRRAAQYFGQGAVADQRLA